MKEKNGEHPLGDVGQLASLGVFLVVWVTDSFFLKKSTFLAVYVPDYLRLGILVLAIATAMYCMKSGHVVIGHSRRPEGLITTGAFRYVRHPLYLASLVAYLGMVLSSLSLFSLAVFIGILIFHNYIATYEEHLLEAKYGEEYRTYKAKTGKWIPGLSRG